MTILVADTHVWVWAMRMPGNLSDTIRDALLSADTVFVSPISLYEVGQKARIGKWPEMMPYLQDLDQRLVEDGFVAAPITAEICLQAGTMDWDHRDPFDRLIAATALDHGATLATRDTAFASLPNLRTLW